MIEDLDGSGPVPDRSAAVRILSVAIAAAAVLAYAAASSTAFQAPFAEPRPSASSAIPTPAARVTIGPGIFIFGPPGTAPPALVCVASGATWGRAIYVDGRTVDLQGTFAPSLPTCAPAPSGVRWAGP